MSLARLCEIVTDMIQRHMHRQAHKVANAERQNGRHCVTDTGHSARQSISRGSELSRIVQPSPRLPETRKPAHNACRRHAAHAGTQTGTHAHDCNCCYCCYCCYHSHCGCGPLTGVEPVLPIRGAHRGPSGRSWEGREGECCPARACMHIHAIKEVDNC